MGTGKAASGGKKQQWRQPTVRLNADSMESLRRIARESHHPGERFAATQAIKKQEAVKRSGGLHYMSGEQDPRLSETQTAIVNGLRQVGFKVTFEFGVGVSTASVLADNMITT